MGRSRYLKMLNFRKLGLSQIAVRLRGGLDTIAEQQKNFADINQVAFLVILEEDIKTLLDEYRLIKNGNSRRPSALKSFYQRAFTIVEETHSLRKKTTISSPPKKDLLPAIATKPAAIKGAKDKIRPTPK